MADHTYSITTTLPYVNADPHIGFALEIVQADVLARYHRLLGHTVFFNTGTDEHGLKIWRNAVEAGLDTKTYCDGYAAKFDGLKIALNLSYTHFIRTTDPHHISAAQEFWRRCAAAGDIYKKSYQVKYCVGCELEKTDSELVDGRCPIHPNREVEFIDEENYFFAWSKYQKKLLDLYASRPDFVVPEQRFNEIKRFVSDGLQDFSISRLKSKMPWGIDVPDDSEQVMYVWFDALVNYISTLGWPNEGDGFATAWPSVQVAGKDNVRQQAAMWQGMLLSAGIAPSRQIFIHGFITADGQKMSKSVGNVINPYDLVAEHGTDAVRHYLLGGLPSYADGDYSAQHVTEWYASKLVNGVGNLASRVAAMIGKYCQGQAPAVAEDIFSIDAFWKDYDAAIELYKFDSLITLIDDLVSRCDKEINQQEPFKKAKQGIGVGPLLYQLAEALRHIGLALLPVMPEHASLLLSQYGDDPQTVHFLSHRTWGGLKPGTEIPANQVLFPRRDPK